MAVAAKNKKTPKPLPKKAKAPAPKDISAKDSVVNLPSRPHLVSSLAPNTATKLPARLQAALDKREISDLIFDFCRGLDRMDETLLRSVCHMDATIDLGPGIFQGLVTDYIPWVLSVLAQVRTSSNFVGNTRIEIEGDSALVESYVQTYYRLDKPTGREDLFLGGRFLDRFERRPTGPTGVWKIVHRKHILDWTRTEGVSEVFYHQNPDALWSNRSKKDPSYQMDQFPGSPNGNRLPAFLGRHFDPRSIKL